MKVAVYRISDGLVTGWLAGDQVPPAEAGTAQLAIADTVDPSGMSVVSGKLVPAPPDVAGAKAARWAQAKAYRATAMSSGCASPLGRVQTDGNSRDAITQAAADAVARQIALPGWSIDWVMADNSVKTHNAAQMLAMAAAVRTYIAGCQAASQAVRTKIYAATTVAAVAATDITAGYPA